MNLRHCALLITIVGPAASAAGSGACALEPGRYEVDVRLELPHVENAGAGKTAVLCVSGPDGTHGLKVLSDNNPLASCPASDVQESDDALRFRIVCPGGNAATASAVYRTSANAFAGVITMKMGGKNMTMTERQQGRRVGDCPASGTPRS